MAEETDGDTAVWGGRSGTLSYASGATTEDSHHGDFHKTYEFLKNVPLIAMVVVSYTVLIGYGYCITFLQEAATRAADSVFGSRTQGPRTRTTQPTVSSLEQVWNDCCTTGVVMAVIFLPPLVVFYSVLSNRGDDAFLAIAWFVLALGTFLLKRFLPDTYAESWPRPALLMVGLSIFFYVTICDPTLPMNSR